MLCEPTYAADLEEPSSEAESRWWLPGAGENVGTEVQFGKVKTPAAAWRWGRHSAGNVLNDT